MLCDLTLLTGFMTKNKGWDCDRLFSLVRANDSILTDDLEMRRLTSTRRKGIDRYRYRRQSICQEPSRWEFGNSSPRYLGFGSWYCPSFPCLPHLTCLLLARSGRDLGWGLGVGHFTRFTSYVTLGKGGAPCPAKTGKSICVYVCIYVCIFYTHVYICVYICMYIL